MKSRCRVHILWIHSPGPGVFSDKHLSYRVFIWSSGCRLVRSPVCLRVCVVEPFLCLYPLSASGLWFCALGPLLAESSHMCVSVSELQLQLVELGCRVKCIVGGVNCLQAAGSSSDLSSRLTLYLSSSILILTSKLLSGQMAMRGVPNGQRERPGCVLQRWTQTWDTVLDVLKTFITNTKIISLFSMCCFVPPLSDLPQISENSKDDVTLERGSDEWLHYCPHSALHSNSISFSTHLHNGTVRLWLWITEEWKTN